jgi:hypothetical protein
VVNTNAFGSAGVALALLATGHENQTAFGSPSVADNTITELQASGFANAQGWGSASATLDLPASGFTNTQAFGSAVLVASANIAPVCFRNVNLFGNPEVFARGVVSNLPITGNRFRGTILG